MDNDFNYLFVRKKTKVNTDSTAGVKGFSGHHGLLFYMEFSQALGIINLADPNDIQCVAGIDLTISPIAGALSL